MFDGVVSKFVHDQRDWLDNQSRDQHLGAIKRHACGVKMAQLLLQHLLERNLLPSALGEQIMSLREHVYPLLD